MDHLIFRKFHSRNEALMRTRLYSLKWRLHKDYTVPPTVVRFCKGTDTSFTTVTYEEASCGCSTLVRTQIEDGRLFGKANPNTIASGIMEMNREMVFSCSINTDGGFLLCAWQAIDDEKKPLTLWSLAQTDVSGSFRASIAEFLYKIGDL